MYHEIETGIKKMAYKTKNRLSSSLPALSLFFINYYLLKGNEYVENRRKLY